ncbi:MAG TPA: FAD binding domain-containing protein [Magnetospirillaceae bacterium]|nr:FAD binding domain-containing protein [Magnetospirillaceae bacterium]
MVVKYLRVSSLEEAGRALSADPRARILAGGTQILSSEYRDQEIVAVDASDVLPRGVERTPEGLARIGSMVTFQDLVDSPKVPRVLAQAARGMGNRNIRNAATVGGNIGANRSCSSLMPVFLAMEARFRIHGRAEVLPAAEWMAEPSGVITWIEMPRVPGLRAAYARWSRTACDISVLTCAAAYRLDAGTVRDLRFACGGLDSTSRRFPELEKLFEGRPLPDRDEAAAAVMPLLRPVADIRGGAAFKRLRAAELAAEALIAALEDAP